MTVALRLLSRLCIKTSGGTSPLLMLREFALECPGMAPPLVMTQGKLHDRIIFVSLLFLKLPIFKRTIYD